MGQLVDPLMGHTQEPRRITRAHLQPSTSQQSNRAPSGDRGTTIFLFGPLSQRRVGANRLHGRRGELDIVDQVSSRRVVNEQRQRLANASARFINRATLRTTAAHLSDGGHPVPGFVTNVGDVITAHAFLNHPLPRHGSRSRSIARSNPGPSSWPACTGIVVRVADLEET